MDKYELIDRIARIDEQLEENRKMLDPYFGSEVCSESNIWRLVEVTSLLLELRYKMAIELKDKYGIFVI